MAHDLGAGDGLAFADGVTVADVEYEASWLAHGLDADEVVGDELGVAFADEWECKSGEVGDIGGGCHILEEESGFSVWAPVVVLVFEDGGHDAELAFGDFAHFGEAGAPLFDEHVAAGFVEDGRLMRVVLFGHDAVLRLTEVAWPVLGLYLAGAGWQWHGLCLRYGFVVVLLFDVTANRLEITFGRLCEWFYLSACLGFYFAWF